MVGHVEVSATGEHLYGYLGDVRPEVAHVIIRREFVGAASNDIGFVRDPETGRYSVIISQFDSRRYNTQWVGRLKQAYAKNAVTKQARKSALHMIRTENREDGSVRITLEV